MPYQEVYNELAEYLANDLQEWPGGGNQGVDEQIPPTQPSPLEPQSPEKTKPESSPEPAVSPTLQEMMEVDQVRVWNN